MRWKDVNLKPDVRLLRQFGGLSASICAGTALWQAVAYHRTLPAILLSVAAVALALLALLRPNWLRVVFVASIVATFPIGWMISNMVLFLLYFGLITPLAIVFRLSGRDLLKLRTPRECEPTFWSVRTSGLNKRSYFKQF